MKRTANRMTIYIIVAMTMVIYAAFPFYLSGQDFNNLPRSIPEAEGVSSSGVVDFLNAVDTGAVELHSFMFLRNGKVIAEGWWSPYGPDYKHIMYSASKTFTATAIGLAVSENRLKVTDRIVSFFPYSLTGNISDYMKQMTVQDLLTMSAGQDPEPSSFGNQGDWITTFLEADPVHKPGTVFKYNNMATFMLSAIIQQVTGETLFEYLMPRIFKPLDIRGIDWDLNPQGINLGMIGLRLRTEDLAKFGQLLLNEGMWNGNQLIQKEWIYEATSLKIKTIDVADDTRGNSSDWAKGYAYQMWLGRNNTVRIDGMGGQFVVLIPEKDAVIVFTANARDTQKQLNLMHDYLIPAIKSDEALAPDRVLSEEIVTRGQSLSLDPGFSQTSNPDFESNIDGKEFILDNNDYNIQSVYLGFKDNICTFAIKRDNKITSIKAGLEEWILSNTSSPSLLAPYRGTFSKSIDASYSIPHPVIKVGARYSWVDDHTIEIEGRFVEESLGSETIVIKLSDQDGILNIGVESKAMPTQRRMPSIFGQPVILRGNTVNIN